MHYARMQITINGESLRFHIPISARDLALFRGEVGGGPRRAEELSLRFLKTHGHVTRDIENLSEVSEKWSFTFEGVRPEPTTAAEPEEAPNTKAVRCRSLLASASCLLPPDEREEALDEWADEIETAAQKGGPVVRRTLSILFRSLPSMALRTRLPSRVSRGGG
jgi:hypothetical protein